ncbi:MAG: phage portal protein [Thermoplasmatales archaeon]|nr:MAG: phage portal protein [Thermoplasmatales archaeon]
MGIFDIFKKEKKEYPKIETKQDVIRNINDLINLSKTSNQIDAESLTITQAIEYYRNVGPLKKAINLITKGFLSIPILLQNIKTGEFRDDSLVLELLNKPNADVSGHEFKEQLSNFFLISGNSFLEATGNPSRPALEIYSLGPQHFNIIPDTLDGRAYEYQYNGYNQTINYFRNELDGRYRFYTRDELKELWHIRYFNPLNSVNNLFGGAQIESIISDIEQYKRSSNHNLSLLKNGARLSAILLKEGVLSDDQFNKLKAQVNNELTGDNNAGKVMLAESGTGKMDLKELSQTNRDMDFKDNKKDNRFEIYKNFDIPIPLISPDHMTMDNYNEARQAVYDDAILPNADRLLNELTIFLQPRYPELRDWKLSYNEQEITALLERSNDNIKMKKDSGVLSINEIRSLYDYEPVPDGDVIFRQSSLVPIDEDFDSMDDISEEDEEEVKSSFQNILRNAGYTEEKLRVATKKYFKEG